MVNYDEHIKRVQNMSGPELNCYEANLKRQLQKVEAKRQKAEAGKINFANFTKAGQIPEEEKKRFLACIESLSEKRELERILAYISNRKLNPEQRAAKVKRLKLQLEALKA